MALHKDGIPSKGPQKVQRVDTAARGGPHEVDDFLRSRGFHIVSRPEGRTPVWCRDGKEYNQLRALRIATREVESAGERKGGV